MLHKMEIRANTANVAEAKREKVGKVIRTPLRAVMWSGVRPGDINIVVPFPNGDFEALFNCSHIYNYNFEILGGICVCLRCVQFGVDSKRVT